MFDRMKLFKMQKC